MLSRYVVQDPDTPTYMGELSGGRIACVRLSVGKLEDFATVISLGSIKWNIDYVAG